MTVTTAASEQWQGQKPDWTEFSGEWEDSSNHMETLSRNFAVEGRRETEQWLEDTGSRKTFRTMRQVWQVFAHGRRDSGRGGN